MLLCCSPLRNPSWTGCRGMEGRPTQPRPPIPAAGLPCQRLCLVACIAFRAQTLRGQGCLHASQSTSLPSPSGPAPARCPSPLVLQ